jgi:1-acyl-sn-glycerol-3-phosphate acyltransferase
MSHPVQFQGSRLARWLLTLAGWAVHFDGLPQRQGVVVVYPHTSNWDFVVLVMVKWAIGIQINFWGKHSLFKIPLFGTWLRWLGGVPVVRNRANGVVADMVQTIRKCKSEDRYFWLALSPEGTRKHTPGWRSGFYRTALDAGVPLGVAQLDFGRKRVVLQDFLQLSGDVAQDMDRIAAVLQGAQGYHPGQAAPITLIEKQ